MIVNSVSSAVFGAKNSALQKRKNVSNPIEVPKGVTFNGLSAVASYNRASLDMINFKGDPRDAFSYENFTKARIQAGILDAEDLEKNLIEENLLGNGKNSVVYAFSEPKLENWVIKVDKIPSKTKKSPDFSEVEDKFEGFNRGQEIARAGDRYHILKRIKGVQHSVDDWSSHIVKTKELTPEDALHFADSIHTIAGFSQKAFNNYAMELKAIDEKGYKMDSINPNNLLIDYDSEEIHIIDFTTKDVPEQQNSSRDLSSALLDFSFFSIMQQMLPEDKKEQFVEDGKTIFAKCEEGAKAAGIPNDRETYKTYVDFVDKNLGWYLEKIGTDNYFTRYKKTEKLIK